MAVTRKTLMSLRKPLVFLNVLRWRFLKTRICLAAVSCSQSSRTSAPGIVGRPTTVSAAEPIKCTGALKYSWPTLAPFTRSTIRISPGATLYCEAPTEITAKLLSVLAFGVECRARAGGFTVLKATQLGAKPAKEG